MSQAESGACVQAQDVAVRSPAAVEADLEALLLLATEPVPTAVLAEAVDVSVDAAAAALARLAKFYDETARGFQLRQLAGGWRYTTRPEQADLISRWVVGSQHARLTQASLETLAVIAYSQPVARSRVSAVRGVNVDGVVRTLLARGLITESGHDQTSGAGLLSTTDYFLDRLGLNSLSELPPLAPHLPEAADLEAELATLAIIPDNLEDADDR